MTYIYMELSVLPDHESFITRKKNTRKFYNTKISRSTVYQSSPDGELERFSFRSSARPSGREGERVFSVSVVLSLSSR